MALGKDVAVNYAGQIYVTLIGIVMLPVCLKYIGTEAYGLVGFFATLQAWFQLLDMGLTPAMARETARFNGGATDVLNLRRLLRTLEGVFIGFAVIGATVVVAGADLIAASWLNVQTLSLYEVRSSVIVMGLIVALRWSGGLYRGVIGGFERQVWLSGWNSLIATMRFVLIVPYFAFIGTTPTHFFLYQLVVALIELLVLMVQAYRLMPSVEYGQSIGWHWSQIRDVLKFSLSIAFTSSVWVMVTQTDKIVLSKLLPLTEYGYFTLAVLIAGGIMMISGPVSTVIMPRMTRLQAAGDDVGVIRLYRRATQFVTIVAAPVALVLALFPGPVLWAMTGNAELVDRAASVLRLYAIGSGILALGAFPYYLQYAKGDLRLHVIGNLLFVVLLIPSLVWATWRFGMVGAGWAWLVSNFIYFVCWIPLVHRRFEPELHRQWLGDVLGICVPTICCAFVLRQVVLWSENRLIIVLQLCLVGGGLLVASALSNGGVRRYLKSRFHLMLQE